MRCFARRALIIRQSEFRWRYRLDNQVASDAPLSEWRQIGEFETLLECKRGYENNLNPPPNEKQQDVDAAHFELTDEGNSTPSNADLNARVGLMESFINNQALQGKCVASDDPRLAK